MSERLPPPAEPVDDLHPDIDPKTAARDNEHLRLLGVFHTVAAALTAVMGCFALPHFVIGIGLIVAGPTISNAAAKAAPPPAAGTTATPGGWSAPPPAAPGATGPTSSPANGSAPAGSAVAPPTVSTAPATGANSTVPVTGALRATPAAPFPVAPAGPPPFFIQGMGVLFAFVGGMWILFSWSIAILMLFSGRNIRRRERHTFCLVAAGIMMIGGVFGIALGVCSLIVLLRPSVKAQFGLPAV